MGKHITDDELYYLLDCMGDEIEAQDITSVCDLICLYAILEMPSLPNCKTSHMSSFPKTIGRYMYRLRRDLNGGIGIHRWIQVCG